MKILLLSQHWAPENSVPQRRWRWLTDLLLSMGHEVTVITPRKINNSERVFVATKEERLLFSPCGFKGESLAKRIASQAWIALGMLITVLRKRDDLKKFDLVIGTAPPVPTMAVAALSGAILKKPYCIDLRDAWPDLLRNVGDWNKALDERRTFRFYARVSAVAALRKILTVVLTLCLERAKTVIVTSEDLAEKLKQNFDDSEIKQSPEVFTIRNVFPASVAPSSIVKPVKDRGKMSVLYAGNIGRAQNLRNAIDAAQIAAESGLEVILRFVGAGAAKSALEEYAEAKGVLVEVTPQRSLASMAEVYSSCHSALVHLTDWEPLERAVPSKTYELIFLGVHISGVAAGESARLISGLQAGHVVAPENPEALAKLWLELDRHPELLEVTSDGAEWVEKERETNVPRTLEEILDQIVR